MVVQSYEQYQQTQEAIALVKLLSMGDKDTESGRLVTGDELLQKLASRPPRTDNSGA
ncbi:hypothetical protein D3C78_1538450 [compost metagenome]